MLKAWRRPGNFARTARFSSSSYIAQSAISSSVRRHPSHRPVPAFIWHTLTQGDATPLFCAEAVVFAVGMDAATMKALSFDYTRFAAMACATREFGLRPSASQMNWPARNTFSMSMPVSMPRPFSMYSTSSVATLPLAPLA